MSADRSENWIAAVLEKGSGKRLVQSIQAAPLLEFMYHIRCIKPVGLCTSEVPPVLARPALTKLINHAATYR
jgi:hypothetical protein